MLSEHPGRLVYTYKTNCDE